MTYEEAREVGEEIIVFYDLIDTEEEAMEILLEATEKQIPKKPDDYYEDSLDDECAVCGTIVFERDRYCPRCGQAIDWSE